MWSTHDGGTTWTQFPTDLTEFLSIDQLALSGNMLYLAGGRDGSDGGIGIDVSPIAADDVTSLDVRIPFGAGPAMDVSMVAQADAVWMVYNDRVVSGSVRILDRVVDTSWVPPAADLGGPVVLHARSEGGPLWAVADAGVWGGDLAIPRSIVYVSDDRGDTFTEVALPPELPSGLGRVVAVPDETSVVISGQIREGPTVFRSSDRGATWQMLSAATFLYTSSLDYVTPDVAFTIQQMDFDPHQELWRSDDGGVTWRTIAIGAPEG
jgi:hypothetical protein